MTIDTDRETETMKEITFEEFAQRRDEQDLRLIDVREEDEYQEVHVKGAELFPLSKIRRGELPEEDDRPTAVICRSGGRSAQACKIFEREGFEECINIDGGTLAAVDAGEEYVERGE